MNNFLTKIGMLCILAVMFLAATSCMEENGIEILPLPPIYEVEDMNIDDVIPQEWLYQIEQNMPIHRGKTPPNVVGCYLNKSNWLRASNVPEDFIPDPDYGLTALQFRWQDLLFKFTNQTPNNSIFYEGRQIDYTTNELAGVEIGQGSISGTGNNFTIMLLVNHKTANYTAENVLILSGTKTSAGIQSFHYCLLVLDKIDPLGLAIPIGSIRIFYDSEFLSKNANWNNGKGKETFASSEFANSINSMLTRTNADSSPNNSVTILPKLIKGGK